MGSLEAKEHERKIIVAAKKKLIVSLHKEYGDIPLLTLADLAEDIKVVPSVRSGDKEERDCSDYYEVTPTKLNHYDELIIEEKELGLANSRLLKKYKLNYGDLLISYRGYRKVLVGRFTKGNISKPVVSAVSNIRISFHEKERDSFSLLVQKYLTSKLAQTYLKAGTNSIQEETQKRRYTLSRTYLADIPIPNFRKLLKEKPLDTLYYTHKDIVASTQELQSMVSALNYNVQEEEEALLGTYLHKNDELSEIHHEKVTVLRQLKLLQKQAEMFLSEEQYEKYKKEINRRESE